MTSPTLPDNLVPFVTYTVQGTENTFTYKFLVVSNDDLYVYVNNVEVSKNKYTVTGIGSSQGGEVTINTLTQPLAAGDIVALSRHTLPEQITEFLRAGDFTADAVNAEFTRLYALMQEQDRDINNAQGDVNSLRALVEANDQKHTLAEQNLDLKIDQKDQEQDQKNAALQVQIDANKSNINKLGNVFGAANPVKPWVAGEINTNAFQRYFYPNPAANEKSYTWSAPLASSSNPVTLGASPIGDNNWQQWDASQEDITQAQEQLLPKESQIFPRVGDLQIGQAVPTGITHLRVGGNIYAMSLVASGLVTEVGDSSVVIGGIGVKITTPEIEVFASRIPALSSLPVGTRLKVLDRWDAPFIIDMDYSVAPDGYSAIAISGMKVARIYAPDNRINVFWAGATGIKTNDQTAAIQSALTYGQSLRSDYAFELYFPLGDFEVTFLTVDRSLRNRHVKFIGSGHPSDINGSTLRFTETSIRDVSMEWDGIFYSENMTLDFYGQRDAGTALNPKWGIDIRNNDNADGVADLDCEFINTNFVGFHRAIRAFGRGISIKGGNVLSGGGAGSEGCLLDLDFPNPKELEEFPEQTLVCGMRAYNISPARVHACSGWLVRNKGYNANNLQQMRFGVGVSDTDMGLIRGAAKNIEVDGGTWLYPKNTWILVEDGFDCYNINVNAPSMIGMPEENIGQPLLGGGTVSAAQVLDKSVGVLIGVSSGANKVGSINWNGGVITDARSDLFQFAKAVDGFSFTNVVGSRLCKENKDAGGTTRHIVNFFNTASTNILIKNNVIKMLSGMAKTGTLAGNASNISEYEIESNFLDGSIVETFARPKDTNFGGDKASVYCGEYTGDNLLANRYVSSRYIKCAIVTRQSTGQTWMAKDGDNVGDVRVDGGALRTTGGASVTGEKYSFSLFF